MRPASPHGCGASVARRRPTWSALSSRPGRRGRTAAGPDITIVPRRASPANARSSARLGARAARPLSSPGNIPPSAVQRHAGPRRAAPRHAVPRHAAPPGAGPSGAGPARRRARNETGRTAAPCPTIPRAVPDGTNSPGATAEGQRRSMRAVRDANGPRGATFPVPRRRARAACRLRCPAGSAPRTCRNGRMPRRAGLRATKRTDCGRASRSPRRRRSPG